MDNKNHAKGCAIRPDTGQSAWQRPTLGGRREPAAWGGRWTPPNVRVCRSAEKAPSHHGNRGKGQVLAGGAGRGEHQ